MATFVFPGLLLFVLALTSPLLRRADGHLKPLSWFFLVSAVAGLLLALSWRTRMHSSGALSAMALVGHASALAMIDAPNFGVLQHYLSWGQLLSSVNGLFLLAPLAQTVLLVIMVRRSSATTRARLRGLISIPQALLILAFVVFSSVYATWDVLETVGELGLALWLMAVNAGNLLAVVAALPEDALETANDSIRRIFSATDSRVSWRRVYPFAIAAWVTIASAVISFVVFERIPHIPDSVSYLFQAKYFSSGQLYLPSPPTAAGFEVGQVVNDGMKWYGYGFPGWPVVLAIGVTVGIPWLVNPVLAGITILLVHALVRRLYNRTVAQAVVTLMAISPWFLFTSASFMAHPISLVWSVFALLSVQLSREYRSAKWGAAAGLSLGALFLVRPLEAVLVGGVIGLWAMGMGGTRLRVRAIVAMVVAGALVSCILPLYANELTGSPTYLPQTKWTDDSWYDGADRVGFGPDIGNVGWPHVDPLPGHGPLDVAVNAHQNAFNSNIELFGWSFGSLGLAALFLSGGRWVRSDKLFIGIAGAVVFGHSFYWFGGGPDFGARYWYQLLIPLVVMTVRGLQELQGRWQTSGGSSTSSLRITTFIAVACMVAFVNYVPWRGLDKYYNYRGMRPDIAQLDRSCDFENSLVFVREHDKSDYPSAFVFNPPTLNSPAAIYVRETDELTLEAVTQQFPERDMWTIAGPSEFEGEFTVVDYRSANSVQPVSSQEAAPCLDTS